MCRLGNCRILSIFHMKTPMCMSERETSEISVSNWKVIRDGKVGRWGVRWEKRSLSLLFLVLNTVNSLNGKICLIVWWDGSSIFRRYHFVLVVFITDLLQPRHIDTGTEPRHWQCKPWLRQDSRRWEKSCRCWREWDHSIGKKSM